MKCFYAFLLLAFAFLHPEQALACGYGFIGDCSTNLGLRINGTPDSFAIATCPGIGSFQGLELGTIQSLALIRAKSINWESCQNNVTSVTLYFRVFQTGNPGGAWQSLTLQEDYNTLVGPYTTRYRSGNANVNLTSGLIAGKDYTLETYFRAEIDTIGDDFIPETFLLQNNDGANFHLHFRYGGPAAPPITVVETKKYEPVCFGDTSGSLSVAVYGNQNGLSFHWSTGSNNYYSLLNVPAGTYAVTVTAAGYSTADTIVLGQPAALTNQFNNIVALGCNNGTGQATAVPSGGTGPYNYHWNNGQTSATVTVTTPGSYTVTVTDTHGCSQVFSQFIPGGSTPVSQHISAEICSGEIYHKGNQSFTLAGVYNFSLPGAGGCDTLVNLELTVLNAGLLLSGLPASGLVTCAEPELNLCATAQPNAVFMWKKDGVAAVTAPCILATAGGNYTVTASLTGNTKTCSAEKTVTMQEHLQQPTASFGAAVMLSCLPSPPDTWLHATTNAQNPSYLWTYNGQVLSTTDSCQLHWTGSGSVAMPTLVVTDGYGCSAVATNNVIFVQAGAPFIYLNEQNNQCNGLTEISYTVFGGTPPYQVTWNHPGITTNPFLVGPGIFSGTVTDAQGCNSSIEIQVVPLSINAAVQAASGPTTANGSVQVAGIGGSYPYSFQWSTGDTGEYLSSLAPGTYCVTMTDYDGCIRDTCLIVGYVSATREPLLGKIGITPNPVSPGEPLDLELPSIFIGEQVQMEVLDVMGRRCWLEDRLINASRQQLLLPAQVPPGVLLIRVSNAEHQATGRCLAR